MRVLVAISILAFLALLWASIAIFRHVRRTQRRRRRALEAARNNLGPIVPAAVIAPPPPPPPVPEITFNDPEAPLPEVTFTDTQAPIREPNPSAVPPYLRRSEDRKPAPPVVHTPKPEVTTADTLPPPPNSTASQYPSHSPLRAWPHFGFTPARPEQPFRARIVPGAEPEHALAAEQALEDHQVSGRTPQPPAEPIPYAAPSESSASVGPARLPLLIHPPAPAVKPVYPSPYPVQQKAEEPPPPVPPRPVHQPASRADWADINKDMGDLSDPVPAPRRSRIRSKNSE